MRRPFYVPPEGRSILTILDLRGPESFLAELDRLANLGSRWASSLLAYIEISAAPHGKIDTTRARTLVSTAAAAGYAYAQYVLAWAMLIDGNRAKAFENMEKAGVQLLAPAALDLALFAWLGIGLERPEPKAAVRLLAHARALGHAGELQLRCVFYRSGKVGVGYQLLGVLLTPFAWIKYLTALISDPFRAEVLSFSPDGMGAVFRSH